MSALLRVYDPAECDEHGVPLDWERCRTCRGTGSHVRARGLPPTPGEYGQTYADVGAEIRRADAAALGNVPPSREVAEQQARTCPTCGGHGSLKAAALASFMEGANLREGLPAHVEVPHRCEGCGHPMSAGEWDGHDPFEREDERMAVYAEQAIRSCDEPGDDRVFWSLCDPGCRHDGLVQTTSWGPERSWRAGIYVGDVRTAGDMVRILGDPVRSPWRQVDVRTLGWPHDLRPKKLAVLCLRCWAERNES